jgi:putative PIN family toxin of toxin-antitoxin system
VTPPVAVIDTNVIVSGLIGGARASPTTVILDAMLGGRFTYLLSLDLLAEYREVLLRSAIRRRHGLTDTEVEVVLTELALNGTLHHPDPPTSAPPDVDDRHLWALLEDATTAVLVTGDDALRRHAPEPARVLSPRQFLARLSGVLRDAGPSR